MAKNKRETMKLNEVIPEVLDDTIELGVSNFDRLSKNKWYIDKTLFIKTILEAPRVILISAPRKYGKTTNMDMLRKFVEINLDKKGWPIEMKSSFSNYQMFAKRNMKICEYKMLIDNHFGMYPVIHIDFQHLRYSTFEEILKGFQHIIIEVFEEHQSYLLNCDDLSNFDKQRYKRYLMSEEINQIEVEMGLRFLTKCLFTYFNRKVFIMIDNLDVPLLNGLILGIKKELIKIIKCISESLSYLIKDNPSVERVLLNSSHHMAKVLVPDITIHFSHTSPEFYKFYGFANAEVKLLLLLRNSDFSSTEFNEIRKWYYSFKMNENKDKLCEIYNMWSIMNYLKFKKFEIYWKFEFLSPIENLLKTKVLNHVTSLLKGEHIRIYYIKNLEIEDIFDLLNIISLFDQKKNIDQKSLQYEIFLQFLSEIINLETISRNDNYLIQRIPNEEIYLELSNRLKWSNLFGFKSLPTFALFNNYDNLMLNFSSNINSICVGILPFSNREIDISNEILKIIQYTNANLTVQKLDGSPVYDHAVFLRNLKCGIVLAIKTGPSGTNDSTSAKSIVGELITKNFYQILERNNVNKKLLVGINVVYTNLYKYSASVAYSSSNDIGKIEVHSNQTAYTYY